MLGTLYNFVTFLLNILEASIGNAAFLEPDTVISPAQFVSALYYVLHGTPHLLINIYVIYYVSFT